MRIRAARGCAAHLPLNRILSYFGRQMQAADVMAFVKCWMIRMPMLWRLKLCKFSMTMQYFIRLNLRNVVSDAIVTAFSIAKFFVFASGHCCGIFNEECLDFGKF